MAVIKGLHAFMIKEQFRKTLQSKGYAFFGLENKSPYNVNIIGVRSDQDIFNKFDDALVVIYRDKKKNWEVRSYSITTDPGHHRGGTVQLFCTLYSNNCTLGFVLPKCKLYLEVQVICTSSFRLALLLYLYKVQIICTSLTFLYMYRAMYRNI